MFRLENHVCLSRGVQVVGVAWRVGDPVADDWGWSHRSGTRWPSNREVGWRCVRSVSCTWSRGTHISWLSLKTKVDGLSVVWPQNHWDSFLVEPQNQGGGGFPSLGLKISSYG
jgi:hypothetical protein